MFDPCVFFQSDYTYLGATAQLGQVGWLLDPNWPTVTSTVKFTLATSQIVYWRLAALNVSKLSDPNLHLRKEKLPPHLEAEDPAEAIFFEVEAEDVKFFTKMYSKDFYHRKPQVILVAAKDDSNNLIYKHWKSEKCVLYLYNN